MAGSSISALALPSIWTRGAIAPASTSATWFAKFFFAKFQIVCNTIVSSWPWDASPPLFDEVAVRVPTRSGIPPALPMAFWLGRLPLASCEMALAEFSLAFADSLVSSLSSGGIPPASTMLVQLAVDSRARFAIAAAACPLDPNAYYILLLLTHIA